MRLLFKILYSAIAVLVIAYLLPGVSVDSITIALIVAVVLAFLNAYLKPLLIVFTIPLTLLTFGLFLLVINAAIILFTDYLIEGFHVNNFWWALLFSLLLSLATSLWEGIDGGNNRKRLR
ncbi:MAG: phage holin family protein [Bacteroidetes bacterium]|nr:phage holin family protein [Bacteroidota bacterium]